MQPVSLADKTQQQATSTLYLVPPRFERVSEGRRLAAPLVGDSDRDHTLAVRGAHPDVIELRPPEGKERIGIGQVRDAIRSAQFSPVQGARKVCFVPRAEALTPEAANALLKTLEEPPREMAFVLLAGHAGDLLPTIVSRSRIVRLAPVGSSEHIAALVSAGYAPHDARWLVSVSDRAGELDRFLGSVIDLPSLRSSAQSRASAMHMTELSAAVIDGESVLRRAALVELLARASRRDLDVLTDGVRTLAAQTRDAQFLFLQDLLAACFESLRQAELGTESESAADQGETTLLMTSEDLRTACLAIDGAHRALSVYAPAEAILLTLFLAMSSTAGGEARVT